MGRKKNSFSVKLIRNILGTVSIIFLICLVVVSIYTWTLVSKESEKYAESMLKVSISEVEKVISSAQQVVDGSVWLVKDNVRDKKYLYDLTERIVKDNHNIIGSAIAFRENFFRGEKYFSPYSYNDPETGVVLSKQLGNDKYDYLSMEWFKYSADHRESHWSEPYFDEGGGAQLMSTYSKPIFDVDGNLIAVMTADIALDWMSDMVSNMRPYNNSRTIVISRSGAFIGVDKSDGLLGETIFKLCDKVNDPRLNEIAWAMVDGKSGIYKYAQKGQLFYAVIGPVSNGWSSAIVCPYKEVLRDSLDMQLIIVILGLLGELVILLVCIFRIRALTKPLKEFSESALSIAKGDFNTPIPSIDSNDEISRLRDSFVTMESSLNKYIEDLKSTTSANERMESELNIARAIQLNMVPHDYPDNENLQLASVLIPAKEVGGDFYDFVIRDRFLYFAIGDVSGKGVPAALVMAILRSAFRFISGLGLSMDKVVSNMNDSVSAGNTTAMFATMFVARINLDTYEMEYCNAGHNPIIVMDPGCKPSYLKAKSNLAVGLFEGFVYEEERIQLSKGSKLLLYTDGVTEAENENKELYGEERLLQWAGNDKKTISSCQQAIDDLLADVRAHAGSAEQNDDITILSIRLK